MFIPKWASRITLKVTSVNVERVQDITEAGAIAEGVAPIVKTHSVHGVDKFVPAIFVFVDLWNSINEKRGFGWYANPFIWIYKFDLVEVKQ